ncbi:MAG: AAA family ATPase [Candidatus Hydrogenedentes bacterium]|nr:AAA family ATPase [Candidatus Hydrogenedentota bacterium]
MTAPEALMRAGQLAEDSLTRLLAGVSIGYADCVAALPHLPPDPPVGDRHRAIIRAGLALIDAGEKVDGESIVRHLIAVGDFLHTDVILLAEGMPTHNPMRCVGDIWALVRESEREALRAALRARTMAGEAIADLADRMTALDEEDATGVIRGLVPDDVCGAPDPPPPIVSNGPLPGTFAILTGDSAAGKTWIAAVQFALSIATSRALWPTFAPTEPRPAVVVTYEDSVHLIKQRLRAVCATFGIPWSEVEAAQRSGMLTFYCMPEQPLFVADATGRPQPTSAWRTVQRRVMATRPALLVVDPLSGAAIYPENSNDAAATVAAHLRSLAKKSGACVLLTAHTSKSGGGDAGQHAMRGASAMTGACRWHARLVKDAESESLRFVVAKNSGGPRPLPVLLEMLPSGPVKEVGTVRRDPQVVESVILDWFGRHPGASVSPGGVQTRKGDADDLVSEVMSRCPGSRPGDVSEAVQNLMAAGRLAAKMEKTANRHKRETLELLDPVYTEQYADDDVPF